MCCTRKVVFLLISKKKCAARAKLFFLLIRSIVVVFFTVLVVFILSLVIFFKETINIKESFASSPGLIYILKEQTAPVFRLLDLSCNLILSSRTRALS